MPRAQIPVMAPKPNSNLGATRVQPIGAAKGRMHLLLWSGSRIWGGTQSRRDIPVFVTDSPPCFVPPGDENLEIFN